MSGKEEREVERTKEETRGRREVKERRRRGRSGARRGTGGRRRKGKKREVGNEVEKRVSGEKKKGRYNMVGGMVMQTMGTKGEGRFPFRYTRVRYVLGRNRRGKFKRKDGH